MPPAAASVQAFAEALPAAFVPVGYQISKVLGRGGFGIVFAGTSSRDGREVALKVALPTSRAGAEELAREEAALRTVGPPHVPAVYERGLVLGQPFLAFEYLRAPTLAEVLVDQAGPVSIKRATEIILAVLDALAAIHLRELVHRDLKPENIFLVDGRAKIIDFGLAKQEHSQPSMVEVTGANEDIGTDEYMSPEQCDGLSDADRRSDIYSIGVLLYELLTGAPPFFGGAAEVREAHRSRRPASLMGRISCPADLDRVVRRCLAKDRAQRFESADDLSRALRAAVPSARASLPSSGFSNPPPQPLSVDRVLPAASSGVREKRTMGLVFFESNAPVTSVQPVITSCGGQIVQTNGVQYVAAFGHDLGDNPALITLAAARQLRSARLSTRLCVDVSQVSVQLRRDGSRRVFSSLFAKKERFPSEADPEGIMLTSAALEVVANLQVEPVAGRTDRFLVVLSTASEQTSTLAMHRTSLIGRDDLLKTLAEAAHRCFTSSEPTIVTVVGEPGHGRSLLAGALEAHVERLFGITPLLLTAQANLVGAVSRLFPNLLARLLDLPSNSPADGGRSLLTEKLGPRAGEQVWAAAALALGWVDANHPDVRRLAAAPGALRLAAARAAGEALRRQAQAKPVALVLDDAHLAEDVVLDAIEYATLKEATARVWICVLVRPGFERTRPTWGTRASRTHTLTLPALDLEDAMELARQLLYPVEYVPPQALSRLAERTQGVPRLLVELVRGLKRDGLVRRSERGTGHYLATDELEKLPDLPIVQWNAIREIEALPAQLAGHARVASVLGNDFSVGELDALFELLEREGNSGDLALDPGVGIQRLIDAGLLIRHRTGRIDFRHGLLRETIYQQVPEAERKKLHGAAFRMYRALAMPDEQRLPRIALHAARSGEKDVAAHAYLELAERSQSAHAYLEAEGAFGKALENLAELDHQRIVVAARGRGLMRFRLGRHEDSVKDLQLARAHSRALGDAEREADLLLDEATVSDWLRDFERSAELVRTAQALPVPRSELLAARLATGLSRIHWRRGEAVDCIRLGCDAAQRAEQLGDSGYETRVIALLMVAVEYVSLGQFEDAERSFEAVIKAAREHSDLLHLGAALNNRAILWFARVDGHRTFDDLHQSVRIARETGMPLAECTRIENLGEVAYVLGDLEQARLYTTRAVELVRQLFGVTSGELLPRELLLARIALYGGEFQEARAILERIRTRIAEGKTEGTGTVELLPASQTLFEMVELAVRDASDAEWEAFEQRASQVQVETYEEVERIEGRALCALRNDLREAAREHFERALELSTRKPNLMHERLKRIFAKAFAL